MIVVVIVVVVVGFDVVVVIAAAAATASCSLSDLQSRHFTLGDDKTDYESTTAAQSVSGSAVDAAARAREREVAARRKKELQGVSFTLGSSAPEYSTTTGSDMTNPGVKMEPRRQVDLQRTNLVLGDDSVDYVSNRMSEEGLQSRKLGLRYQPKSGASCLSVKGMAVAPSRSKAELASTSWTMGSASWEPEASAAADYSWPDADRSKAARAPTQPTSRKSHLQFGDDPVRYRSATAGAYAYPHGAERRPPMRPDNKVSYELGTAAPEYVSSAHASYDGKAPEREDPKAAARQSELRADLRRGHFQLGDERVEYESETMALGRRGGKPDPEERAKNAAGGY